MTNQERIAGALNSMPAFYEHEFGEWKALLAERIERFGIAAARRALTTPTIDFRAFEQECINAGIEALRSGGDG